MMIIFLPQNWAKMEWEVVLQCKPSSALLPAGLFLKIFEGDQKLFKKLKKMMEGPGLNFEQKFWRQVWKIWNYLFFFGYEKTEESGAAPKNEEEEEEEAGPWERATFKATHTHPNPPPCCLLYAAAQGSSFFIFF